MQKVFTLLLCYCQEGSCLSHHFILRRNMSVTKHLVLKIKNLKTQPHNDTRIRIKLLGGERCPMTPVDLSPSVLELIFVEEWVEKEIKSLAVTGGSSVMSLIYRIAGGGVPGGASSRRARSPPGNASSLRRCLQTNGTRGCPNCRRLSVKPGYV